MSLQETVIKIARAYADVTGVKTIVIDETGRPLDDQPADELNYGFCRLIQEKAERKSDCQEIHLYGSYQAERFGEAYVFFCPFGMVHWVAPVLNEGRIQFSLVAGPVLMSKAEEVLIEEIFSKQKITMIEISDLQIELNHIPYFNPNQVQNMAALLMTSAFYLSNNQNQFQFSLKYNYRSQQVLLNEVVKELKRKVLVLDNYLFKKEAELLLKIRLSDQIGTQKILNEINEYIFFSSGNELESIRSRIIELVVLLSRAARECGVDGFLIFGTNYQHISEIASIDTINEIAHWLSRILARFIDCIFNQNETKNIDVMYKVVNYLQEHYMEDICLEKLAKMVYLNPSYLSKLFKEEMKSNFCNYLNDLRVENSKRLLLDATIPLAEVAEMTGFQDQSYYTKVFKKITKMSPTEFRKARGIQVICSFLDNILFSGSSVKLNKEKLMGAMPSVATPITLNIAVFIDPEATIGNCVQSMIDVVKANQFKVKTITAMAIKEPGGLNDFDVLIIPGGGGTAEAKSLGESGCAAIEQFVKNGGGYIGTCAGAYLAALGYNTATSWLELVNAEIVDVIHWNRGSGTPLVRITEPAHPIMKGFPETFHVLYVNGPLFKPGNNPALPPYQELANYVDDIHSSGEAASGVMPGTSALITCTYGNGRCVLFGFHPEPISGLGNMLIQAVRWAKGLE